MKGTREATSKGPTFVNTCFGSLLNISTPFLVGTCGGGGGGGIEPSIKFPKSGRGWT